MDHTQSIHLDLASAAHDAFSTLERTGAQVRTASERIAEGIAAYAPKRPQVPTGGRMMTIGAAAVVGCAVLGGLAWMSRPKPPTWVERIEQERTRLPLRRDDGRNGP